MIELKRNQLVFSFPEVHPQARLSIDFQRTLRIPDDGRTYPLPPGLGRFPVRHVDDFAATVPTHWREHGGVLLPLYQSEALWLNFHTVLLREHRHAWPFAIKVAAGKINAVTGQGWSAGLQRQPQDYLVAPQQPWLDGYCVAKGLIRQFVAMPLGAGYSAEEQLTGVGEFGGLQLLVYPMKREVFERRFPYCRPRDSMRRYRGAFKKDEECHAERSCEMGLAAGGRMTQEIYADDFEPADWDLEHSSRVFVHLANSLVWRALTGQQPPTTPPTARQYARHGLPWFDYYDESVTPLTGAPLLQGVKSVVEKGKDKGDVPLPENESCTPTKVVPLKRPTRRGQIREGSF